MHSLKPELLACVHSSTLSAGCLTSSYVEDKLDSLASYTSDQLHVGATAFKGTLSISLRYWMDGVPLSDGKLHFFDGMRAVPKLASESNN